MYALILHCIMTVLDIRSKWLFDIDQNHESSDRVTYRYRLMISMQSVGEKYIHHSVSSKGSTIKKLPLLSSIFWFLSSRLGPAEGFQPRLIAWWGGTGADDNHMISRIPSGYIRIIRQVLSGVVMQSHANTLHEGKLFNRFAMQQTMQKVLSGFIEIGVDHVSIVTA